MKNVRSEQIRRCIIFDFEEFKDIFVEIFGEYGGDNEVDVEYSLDGLYFDGISNEEVFKKLSEYFDVTVTSVHADDCDVIGIWVCYVE